MLKTLRLLFTFYKSFLFVSLLITSICVALFWQYGYSIFSSLFWFKILTLGLTYYFINDYKKKEYYYYQNLGISKELLWVSTILSDIIFFIILITQIYKLK